MKKSTITRRTFIKKSTVLGASSILLGNSTTLIGNLAIADTELDISVVKGVNYFQNTIKAVENLGGMKQFVPRQSKVGLLINSPFNHRGSYVNPEITLAVVCMCLEAGAKEVGVFKSISSSYWRRSKRSSEFRDEIRQIKDFSGDFVEKPIPQGRSLKEAEIARVLLECDVFINIPITKDHTGVQYTGTFKNMMGATSWSTNSYFHHGSGASGYYDDVDFLAQCIADVNLLRRPDLCVYDSTEVLVTNGPSGPGRILKAQTVFAGTDPVATETYGAGLIGLRGDDVLTTKKAYDHGMGEIDLSKLRIGKVAL